MLISLINLAVCRRNWLQVFDFVSTCTYNRLPVSVKMIPVLAKLSALYKWYVLAILTLGYLTAELGHFLIGVTSKATAVDVGYGDITCQLNKTEPHFNHTLNDFCSWAYNESRYVLLQTRSIGCSKNNAGVFERVPLENRSRQLIG